MAPTEPAAGNDAEDEELRRVLELSLQDQGGRSQWNYYGGSGSGAGAAAGAAGGSGALQTSSTTSSAPPSQIPPSVNNPFLPQAQAQGHPPRTSSSALSAASTPSQPQLVDVSPAGASAPPGGASAAAAAAAAALGSAAPLTATPHHAQGSGSASSSGTWDGAGARVRAGGDTTDPLRAAQAGGAVQAAVPSTSDGKIVSSRVRALYDFSSSEPGELNFSAGDIIRVLDTVYEHWWRGEVRGTVGIFPVNHVEVLPNPTPDDLARDATAEAAVLASATVIDLLSHKLATLDAAATAVTPSDKAELDRNYAEAAVVAPQLHELIDRYTAKLTELRGLSDKFDHARIRYAQVTDGRPAATTVGTDSPAHAAQTQGLGTGPVTAVTSEPPPPLQSGVPAGVTTDDPAPTYGADQTQSPSQSQSQPQPQPQSQSQSQSLPQAQPQANPQPPPNMDFNSPEYAEWYYRMYPQMAPQQ